MAQKISVLAAAIALAAAAPPLISYLPGNLSFLTNTTPHNVQKPAVALPEYQPAPYSNSVNQLNAANQRQASQINAPQAGAYQVSYAPSSAPKPEDYSPAVPLPGASQPVSTQGQVVYSTPQAGSYQTVGAPVAYNQPVPQGAISASYTGFEPFFRFDISPNWVEQNWDFVTACVGPMNLQGYRVVLVTGSAPDDLTGVITYYFDSRRQLQEIKFQGTTGDLGRLTAMLNKQFNMSRRIVNDPSLTIYETPASLKDSKSLMEARAPMVIKSDQLYHRYEVYILLSRPAEKKGLLW